MFTTAPPTPTIDTSNYAWRYALGALIALLFIAGMALLLWYVLKHPEYFKNDAGHEYAELASHDDNHV